MPTLNLHDGTALFKITFYGPAHAGKERALQVIRDDLPEDAVGKMEYDHVPDFIGFKINRTKFAYKGFAVQFHLVTFDMVHIHEQGRIVTLKDTDGVVFVAHKEYAQLETNVIYLKEAARGLLRQGKKITAFPLVLQYNHSSFERQWHRPKAIEPLPIAVLEKYLNPIQWPYCESIISQNAGVIEGYQLIIEEVAKYYQFTS